MSIKNVTLLVGFFLLFATNSHSQIFDPVKWETSVEKVSETEFDLIMLATIDTGWHLYSQNVPSNGPTATKISFTKSEEFELFGNPTESEGHESYDPVFNMEIKYFENSAVFKQRIKTITENTISIKGVLEFGVCDNTSCLPPTEVEFEFRVQGKTSITSVKKENKIEVEEQVEKEIKEDSKSLWTLFILSFFAGFAALLTPCVFPMIPMTVSFFTKQSKNKSVGIRNAIIFGLAIIMLYVLLGTVVTAIFGADALNALSTNVWFNIIFFVLLVFFAISFLGAFEITLPSSWGTKVDAQADRGGFVGIFFMAMALAIVSFSCTGPIVGTALVAAASQGGIAPVISMFGFSLAIALPFALFAAFPGWLNSLPKSGGWLNTVKVVLGFLELALAFKFLSNADLVMQTHLLEREIFIAIWIAIFGVFSLYLFGKIKLPHDSNDAHISVGRLSFGLVVLTFTIYLIPGLWGAPLKLISGFPPPMHYSESSHGVGYTKLGTGSNNSVKTLPKGAHFGPHDIVSFLDYDLGMAYAKKTGKPVMIDFTGHACVNCRKMEERVWSDPQVLKILMNDLILISLYVDDKRVLPKEQQYISELNGKKRKIKTIGNKWSDFQIKKYKANAQPYYVLLDHKGENLNKYSAYNSDIEEYLFWLKEGVSNFKNE